MLMSIATFLFKANFHWGHKVRKSFSGMAVLDIRVEPSVLPEVKKERVFPRIRKAELPLYMKSNTH